AQINVFFGLPDSVAGSCGHGIIVCWWGDMPHYRHTRALPDFRNFVGLRWRQSGEVDLATHLGTGGRSGIRRG
ncbi:hypothetical protein, partial [Thermogutta sp.]|uniref:hypothetical protein n=1 Tax=Thermogutta sp. TaxID=1962930 RepID=UPI0025FB7C9A